MLWSQKIKVFTGHKNKNLVQQTLGLTSDHVYQKNVELNINSLIGFIDI